MSRLVEIFDTILSWVVMDGSLQGVWIPPLEGLGSLFFFGTRSFGET